MATDKIHLEQEISQLLASLSRVRRQQIMLAKEEIQITDALIEARAMLRGLNKGNGEAEPLPELPSFVFRYRPASRGDVSRPKNPDRLVVIAAISEILTDAGKPLGVQALYDELLKRGIEIRGRKPEVVLTTMLWRSRDRIARLGKAGYWLASE